MSLTKKTKLEQAQRELVQKLFFIEPNFHEPQTIHDQFKKMKPLTGLSRVYKEYNKRYFTINLEQLIFYYTEKEFYSLSDITYIPLEVYQEIKEISDKPHYALSNQGIEWREAFGFTIYLHDNYIVLVAKTNAVYDKWLHYFEAIRFRNTGKSILKRNRTENIYGEISQPGVVYFNNCSQPLDLKQQQEQQFIQKSPQQLKQKEEQKQVLQPPEEQTQQKQTEIQQQQEKQIDAIQQKKIGEKKEELQVKNDSSKKEKDPQQLQFLLSKNEEKNNQTIEKPEEKNNQIITKMKMQEKISDNKEKIQEKTICQQPSKSKEQYQDQIPQKQLQLSQNITVPKQVHTNEVQQDFKQLNREKNQFQTENIIVIGGGNSDKKNVQKEQNLTTILPKRLDIVKGKKQQQFHGGYQQNPIDGNLTLRKSTNQPVNIWEERDNDGNLIVKPTVLLSNYLDYEKNNDSDDNKYHNGDKKDNDKKQMKEVIFDDDDVDENEVLNSILGIKSEDKPVKQQNAFEHEKINEKNKFFFQDNLDNNNDNDEDEDQTFDYKPKIKTEKLELVNIVEQIEFNKDKTQQQILANKQNYDDWDDDA